MTLRVALFLISCFLVSCSTNTTTTPTTPTTTTLVMERLTDLPYNGGTVTSVDVIDANTVLAVIDGKLATCSATGGVVTFHASPANAISAVMGSGGEVYVLTYDSFWVVDKIGGTPQKTSIFTRNGQTLDVKLSVSPAGQPLLRMYTYPTSMKTMTSADRGVTWTELDLPTKNEYGGGLAYGANNTMYVSSPNSFQVSDNGGTTWQKFPAVIPNYGGELLVRKNGDVLCYVRGGGGLWSSSTNGASFTNLTPFNQFPFHVKIVEGADGNLYSLVTTGTTTDGTNARVMRSADGGKTWQHVLFAQATDLAASGAVMATGFDADATGGLAVSSNNGSTFVSAGTRTALTMQGLGFTADGSPVIMADKGLYVRSASAGWQTFGGQSTFTAFTTAASGKVYVTGLKTCYASGDNGKTFSPLTLPDLFTTGVGTFKTPVLLGLQDGTALLSRTYYRTDLQLHTNGLLERVTSAGVQTTLNNGTNYVWMAQDATGTIWARTDNFVASQKSSDNAATFVEIPTAAPGVAFTSTNRAFKITGAGTYTISDPGLGASKELTLGGFTSAATAIIAIKFDAANKLYLVTANDGVFVATTGL